MNSHTLYKGEACPRLPASICAILSEACAAASMETGDTQEHALLTALSGWLKALAMLDKTKMHVSSQHWAAMEQSLISPL